ncbi:hypothetical protein GCM10023170_099090 [Phytohabitans houttuyneae]
MTSQPKQGNNHLGVALVWRDTAKRESHENAAQPEEVPSSSALSDDQPLLRESAVAATRNRR